MNMESQKSMARMINKKKGSSLAIRPGKHDGSKLCGLEKALAKKDILQAEARSVCDDRSIRRSTLVLKAVSDSSRARIVNLLSLRKMCVCEIMVALDMTQSVASHHLKILESAGIVTKERRSKWVYHSLADPTILSIMNQAASIKPMV